MYNIYDFVKKALILTGAMYLAGCDQPLIETPLANPIFDQDTVTRLNDATLENHPEIIANLFLDEDGAAAPGFTLANPYDPETELTDQECAANSNCVYAQETLNRLDTQFPAQPVVYDWWIDRETDPDFAEVCGIKFLDDAQLSYRLDTFANLDALRATEGYQLTHYLACGACSTLQDLAVYGTLDLTVMAKTCSKRLTLDDKKSCMQEIGFTEPCAEVWAYNGRKTGQTCAIECIKEYGLLNLLLGNENSPPVNEDGELNRCLMCDEMMSGPGFQYGSGRTRRNSGITSEIDRPQDQIYSVTHDYF